MTLIEILIAALAGLTALYLVGVNWLVRGVGAAFKQTGTAADRPDASVIIAARNEESSIGPCLRDVLSSIYDSFEVIVVDDGSTDSTTDVVSAIAETSRLRVRLVTLDSTLYGSGKVAAITRGVAEAEGDVVVTLDADCRVGPRWLPAMISFMTPDVGFVSGPVAYNAEPSVVRRIEALEFISLIAVGAGAIGQGRPLICNSANAAYRRGLFEEMMRYRPPGDLESADELLMDYVHTHTPYSVAFCSSRDAVVRTDGADSFAHFVRQRMRWVGIVPHLPRGHRVALATAYLFFLAIVVCLAAGAANPILAAAAIGAFLLKSAVDARLVQSICRPLGLTGLLVVLPLAELLYLPYVLLTAPAGILRPTEWKGRVAARQDQTAVPVSVETHRV